MISEQTKKLAFKALERRDLSVGELTAKLTEKGVAPVEAEECADWLTELHLLDDEKYAALVARHYTARGFGPAKLRDELYRRRVPKEYWDAALAELPAPDDSIDRLLAARLRSPEPDERELNRAAQSLMRRGFGWQDIKAAVERWKSAQN